MFIVGLFMELVGKWCREFVGGAHRRGSSAGLLLGVMLYAENYNGVARCSDF